MGTRAVIHFCTMYGPSGFVDGKLVDTKKALEQTREISASIYQHYDGYPSSIEPDLKTFFDDVLRQSPGDTRFGDASYLAARFLAWKLTEDGNESPLASMTGYGIVNEVPGDVEFQYLVLCDGSGGKDGRPSVLIKQGAGRV